MVRSWLVADRSSPNHCAAILKGLYCVKGIVVVICKSLDSLWLLPILCYAFEFATGNKPPRNARPESAVETNLLVPGPAAAHVSKTRDVGHPRFLDGVKDDRHVYSSSWKPGPPAKPNFQIGKGWASPLLNLAALGTTCRHRYRISRLDKISEIGGVYSRSHIVTRRWIIELNVGGGVQKILRKN